MSTTLKKSTTRERTPADQGRDFAQVIDLFVDGQPVDKPVEGAAHTFRMKRNMQFGGVREAVVEALAEAFPGCTFAWAE